MLLHLYHITPTTNNVSILTRGLDPAFSRGKRKTVWLCDWTRIHWALAHVSFKHETPVNELSAFMITLERSEVINTAWRGIYNYSGIIKVTHNAIMESAIIIERDTDVY